MNKFYLFSLVFAGFSSAISINAQTSSTVSASPPPKPQDTWGTKVQLEVKLKHWCTREGMEDCLVNFGDTYQAFSSVDGTVSFINLPLGTPLEIKPIGSSHPGLGFTTQSLQIFQEYLDGTKTFTSPYQLLSADANRSGSVNQADIDYLRDEILGIHLEPFDWWRFVRSSQVFTDSLNPFLEPLQETLLFTPTSLIQRVEFLGYPVGQFSCWSGGCEGFATKPEDRTVVTNLPDRTLQPGEEFTLHFTSPEAATAWQGTLDFKALELLEVVPEGQLDLRNFGQFDDRITFAISDANQSFTLRFRALEAGQLSQMLRASDAVTTALSFDATGQASHYKLEFTPALDGVGEAFIAPNPASAGGQLFFDMLEDGPVTVELFNSAGSRVYAGKKNLAKGQHTWALAVTDVPAVGVYACSITQNGQVKVVKWVRQ